MHEILDHGKQEQPVSSYKNIHKILHAPYFLADLENKVNKSYTN